MKMYLNGSPNLLHAGLWHVAGASADDAAEHGPPHARGMLELLLLVLQHVRVLVPTKFKGTLVGTKAAVGGADEGAEGIVGAVVECDREGRQVERRRWFLGIALEEDEVGCQSERRNIWMEMVMRSRSPGLQTTTRGRR